MNDSNISVKFKFSERKFEVVIENYITIFTLKNIIKETLLRRVNLKKYGYDIKKLSEKDIILYKSTTPLILNEKFNKKKLFEVGIHDNEELIVGLNIINDESEDKSTVENNKESIEQQEYSKFSIQRKIIPGDNSCLFNAINYAINQCLTESRILRELVAVEIQSNPELYNEAVLEKKPEEYCDWIMRDDTWGGGIEMSILSKYFQVAIIVVDIQYNTTEIIGDCFTNVIYLLYNGSHYDVFVKTTKEGRETGIFKANDQTVKNEVYMIANEIIKKKSDEDKRLFKIKCDDCSFLFRSNSDAANHAKNVGHSNFHQIPDSKDDISS